MKRRIFLSIFLTSCLVLVITAALIIVTLYNDFTNESKSEISTELSYIVKAYNENIEYLKDIGRNSNNRITLIQPDGAVIYDSFAEAASLPNHLERPEILSAINSGVGESTRNSDTLGAKTYYYAVKLNDGNILRIASTMKSILKVINSSTAVILMIVAFVLVLDVIVARLITVAIVEPINKINLDYPLLQNTYDELSPLLLRMEKQNSKIAQQLSELNDQYYKFNIITANMTEALVIFDENKHVFFANKFAYKIFPNTVTGLGFLELSRDINYIQAVESSFKGKSSYVKLNIGSRVFQVSLNPVKMGDTYAAVLFAVDITEREDAEQLRREFSANVSHELKTPLTSIMGYAEIMFNGVAKIDDFHQFSERIYSESKRLLSLIDDIIKLSKLDENENSLKAQFVPIDLYSMSESIIRELSLKADSANVSVSLKGEHMTVRGIPQTMHEMIFNLCDNAIIYNRSGGSVTICISNNTVSVSDTGIGIAQDYQSRIFERFFRINKSRSKQLDSGGTGLGLSIVKHGAALHNAKIKLESTLNEGTTVSLIFDRS